MTNMVIQQGAVILSGEVVSHRPNPEDMTPEAVPPLPDNIQTPTSDVPGDTQKAAQVGW